MKKDLYVLISVYDKNKIPLENAECIMISDLARKACSREILDILFKYKSVTLITQDNRIVPVPFMVAGACRLLTFGKCRWKDDCGEKSISFFTMIPMFFAFLRDYLLKKHAVHLISKDLQKLNSRTISKPVTLTKRTIGKISYVRSDIPCGLNAGGSVGHIAGVLNNIESVSGSVPDFLTTDIIPLVNENIKTLLIRGKYPYSNIKNFNTIAFNKAVYEFICKNISLETSLVYHRYALDSYAVAKYCLENNIPYILEYNGSELWILKHWSGESQTAKLSFPELSYGIEDLVLKKASLITCVSAPLKPQLLEAGIPDEKILVNPNGVNEAIYRPDIDGSAVRHKYGIADGKIVIGFIGTFGAWHGTENLAKVFAELAGEDGNIHLLMVGDGMKMPEVKDSLKNVAPDRYTLTGMVPQSEGARHLAACDILVSPTVPNPDGTPFFGSPTKLFEYMAMGKAIVCSGMDQMAQILEHGKTALLCKPGDMADLKACIKELIGDEDMRHRLGANARKEVCEKYTWRKHTEKIFERFFELEGNC